MTDFPPAPPSDGTCEAGRRCRFWAAFRVRQAGKVRRYCVRHLDELLASGVDVGRVESMVEQQERAAARRAYRKDFNA